MENGRLRVETLGSLRVYAGDREIAVGPPKQRALFTVLALRGDSVVSRDELVDRLWGAAPPATAAGSVHTYLSGLRRVLAGVDGALSSSSTFSGVSSSGARSSGIDARCAPSPSPRCR